jgi:hypothetical protein
MYRYAQSSKQSGYRSATTLTNDQIAHYAPSVLAESAHESRGERYTFIPTIQVLDALRSEGFQPFEVRQTKVRDEGKREHTKHLVRLRHATTIESAVGEEVPEIVLVNSHDGSSSYQLLSGFFRMVCSNGLIAGNICNDIRVRHSGNVIDDVIEGSFRVLDNVEEIGSRIDTYKAIELKPEEQEVFANAALQLRWDGAAPVETNRILRPRRWDDRKDDLWTTFNRVQENMLKGGVPGRSATGRRMTTRAIGGVNENVKLNRALWTLADGLAQLKQGMVNVEELIAA